LRFSLGHVLSSFWRFFYRFFFFCLRRMKIVSVVEIVFLSLLARCSALPEQAYLRQDEPECTRSAKLDLQLIVDSSYSVGFSNFKSMMTGIADGLISQFDIGEDKTRVALLIYNKDTYDIFGLEKYTDAPSLKEAIKAVKYKEKGSTYTAEAMQAALISYKDMMRGDSKTARVCVVFTDGNANDYDFLPKASKAWADQGVTVFAVGIGDKIPLLGLQRVAGSKERIMTVADFKSIGREAKSLLVKVCKAIPSSKGEGGGGGGAFSAIAMPTIGSCDGKENLAVGGSATASSEYPTRKAWEAFAGPNHDWHSADGMPQSVTYKLKEKAVVCKITFLPRKDNSWEQGLHGKQDCPTNFRIEGSYDGVSFNLLKRVEGNTCKKDQIIKHMLNNCAEYRYYRILVESVPGRSSGAKYVLLRDIQMFGTTASKCPPSECFVGKGETYRGFRNTTRSGQKCQNWNSNWPHKPHSCCTPTRDPSLQSNYCRNPDDEAEPWCYTMDRDKRFEYCGIPKCSSKDILDMCKSSSDVVIPLVYDGTAGASSKFSAEYSAQKAFNQADPEARWCSTAGYPSKIWYKFSSAVRVAMISFSSIEDSQNPDIWTESPKAFNVIASNDCSTWDTLLSVTMSGFTGQNQEKSWQIPCTQQNSYRCYGIEATENLGYPRQYISLKKMKMFQ